MNDITFATSDFTAAPTGSAGKMATWVMTKLKRQTDKLPVVYGSADGVWTSHKKTGDVLKAKILEVTGL